MRQILNIFAIVASVVGAAVGQNEAACPSISVTGPAGIAQPGELFSFTGTVDGKTPENVTYQWAVTGGRIVEGQGTLRISVDADWDSTGTTITSTFNVLGLREGCPKSASGSAGVTSHLAPILIDEFSKRPKADIEARFRKFFVELANNPNNQGYIINYGTDKEIAERERLIVKSVAFRRFDRSRITLVNGGEHENGTVYTKLYRIPPGADNPPP